MESEVREAPVERKRSFKRESEESWLDKKIKAINESEMPEAQKMALLKEIGAVKEEQKDGEIPFLVYAKIKKISVDLHKAMMNYPKAKGVSLASIQKWDEIFKEF